MIANTARFAASTQPFVPSKPILPEPVKLDSRFVKFVEQLAIVPLENNLASLMEDVIKDSTQLYAAARYLNCPEREANILKHSKNLRMYLGINHCHKESSALSTAGTAPTIASQYATEALAWAASRSEMPYQEFAISKFADVVRQDRNRPHVIDALTILGSRFNTLHESTRQFITTHILTESTIRSMPSHVLRPFLNALASNRPKTADRHDPAFARFVQRFEALGLATLHGGSRKK